MVGRGLWCAWDSLTPGSTAASVPPGTRRALELFEPGDGSRRTRFEVWFQQSKSKRSTLFPEIGHFPDFGGGGYPPPTCGGKGGYRNIFRIFFCFFGG